MTRKMVLAIFILWAAALGSLLGALHFPAYAAPPTTDWTWATTAALQPPDPATTARVGFTGTLLTEGNRVLVAGGYYYDPDHFAGGLIEQTQVFTLSTGGIGKWKTLGKLNTPRKLHTATRLETGQVLLVGGNDSATTISDCELVDGTTGNGVSTSNPLKYARRNHTATLLKGGKVLVVGGEQLDAGGIPTYLDTAEVCNPDGKSWNETKTKLEKSRIGHSATRLEDGRVLVVGGFRKPKATEPPGSIPAIAECELYDPQTDSWESTGFLNQARGWHTAILLTKGSDKGKVMVVGGATAIGGTSLDSCEIYDPDPQKETWESRPGKHLQRARAGHAAIELKDGNVLVVGGGPDPDTAYTSEIYQPKTAQTGDSWTYIRSGLNFPRLATLIYPDISAILLENQDGWVLLAGGGQVGCELFKPHTSAGFWLRTVLENQDWSWKTTSAVTDEEYRLGAHTATWLKDTNQVLVTGGYWAQGKLGEIYKSTPIYSVQDDTWNVKGHSLTSRRAFHTATLLTSGKVLVAGGQTGSISPLSLSSLTSCELCDPAQGGATAADLPDPRVFHTATQLEGDRVLLAGGGNIVLDPTTGQLDAAPLLDSSFLYDGSWKKQGDLNKGRIFHTATKLTKGKYAGQVLVVGGFGTDRSTGEIVASPLTVCELYKDGTWSTTGSLPEGQGRALHTATLLADGKVLVAGGQQNVPFTYSTAWPLRTCFIYDPDTGHWTQAMQLQVPRSGHTATLLTKGPYAHKVLVAGPKSSEIYDPGGDGGTYVVGQDGWELTKTGLNFPRNYGVTATLLENDSYVFVFGGNGTTGAGEIFQGPKSLGGVLNTGLQVRIQKLLQDLPTGKKLIKIWNFLNN